MAADEPAGKPIVESSAFEPAAAAPEAESSPFCYADGVDHLSDELVYVRALLRRYVSLQLGLQMRGEDDLGGLAVDRSEIRRFLDGVTTAPDPEEEAYLVAIRREIDARVAASRTRGIRLPLADLCDSFALSALETQVLLVLLAPELDTAYERAYSFAWNDFTRKTADVGFVLGMVDSAFRGRCEASLLFSPTEPLRWNGLIEMETTGGLIDRAFLARQVRVPARVVTFLLGDPVPDDSIHPFVRLVESRATRDEIVLQEEDKDRIRRTLWLEADRPAGRVVLRGPPGCGKKLILESVLAERQTPLLVVDLGALLTLPHGLDQALRSVRREARLRGAALYLDCMGIEVAEDISRLQKLTIERHLRDFPGLVAFGSSFPLLFFGGARGGVVDVLVPLPEPGERARLWQACVPRSVKLAPGTDLEQMAKQYPLSGGAIANAVRGAVARARQRDPIRPIVRRADLLDSARQQLTGRLSALATRIATSLSWKDLVLPEDAFQRLHELTAFARHRKKVFEEWGFGALLPYGRGLSALFHGPPGTGKTMVAGIIAGELGMDLFRVDLSQIVSKYVGETEKNLARIFDEAGQSHSVLLFDEADSLFSKRTEVKSATDRYANLEVNYLLQRMEDFDGVTVLTTNFEKGIDDAFKRRIRFRIEFPFPDEASREELWRRMLPPNASAEGGIRWDDLAYDFELSGGHIKNAVLRAAFVAAERNDMIRYADLRAAASLECKEIGKLVRELVDEDEPQLPPGKKP